LKDFFHRECSIEVLAAAKLEGSAFPAMLLPNAMGNTPRTPTRLMPMPTKAKISRPPTLAWIIHDLSGKKRKDALKG
jgi:hypothetical protein